MAKMAMTIVLDSIEDEGAFSTVGFVKGKSRNKLGDHLPLCVQMFTQKFYTLKTSSTQRLFRFGRRISTDTI